MGERPNIVIFNPDQFRADALSHLGNKACHTPNLDHLALVEGVSFASAFCQNPVCTPSRCSFMSGWYPHTAGHRTMHYMMHEGEPVLLKTLKDHGYFVWWGGKNDLVPADADLSLYCNIRAGNSEGIRTNLHHNQSWRPAPQELGYYSMFAGKLGTEGEIYHDSDEDDVQHAIAFIKEYDRREPFCIYLALQYPHPPYGVEEPFYSSADREQIQWIAPDTVDFAGKPSILSGIREKQNLYDLSDSDWTDIRSTYYGMCSRIDDQFGRLCEALRECGQYENTLILVLSDHGDFTGDYGLVEKTQNTFEDCLTRVPLLIKPPVGHGVSPGISQALVELLDIPATVLSYAQIPLEYHQFGKSLLPLVSGDSTWHREFVCCEGGRLAEEDWCKETLPQELDTASLYYPRQYCQALNDRMHTKAVMIRNRQYKYVYRLYEEDEFYDLTEDPGERQNRVGQQRYASIQDQLQKQLLQFYMETADVVPLRKDRRF